MSTLVWVHLTSGIVALLAGTAVVLTRKGRRQHKHRRHRYRWYPQRTIPARKRQTGTRSSPPGDRRKVTA